MSVDRICDLYERLYAAYGPQEWWPADGPFEMIVGAILTQRTAWRNAERAIRSMRRSGLLSVEAIDRVPVGRLAEAVRSAGFYNAKAATLKRFARYLIEVHGGALDRLFAPPMTALRRELLGLRGIGQETADAILVYAAGKPSFVIDAYARRLLRRLGWIDGRESYGALRGLFLGALPEDVSLLGEFHALFVRHGKARCRATPVCGGCPIVTVCATGSDGKRTIT